MNGKLIVTPEQYAEGFIQFVNGVIIKRRFENGIRLRDGNYIVTDPRSMERPRDPNMIPIVDAR